MQTVEIQITGSTPMLMHADTLADPLAPETKAFRKISGKKTKTDADHEAMGWQEFNAGLYYENDHVVLPGRNIMKCLVEGGRVTKSGMKIERGVVIGGPWFPLEYDGPPTPEALYADRNFVSRMTVVIGRQRTIRCRPIFRKWAVRATVLIDPKIINLEDLQDIASDAGSLIGICDYRRMGGFGRFEAEVRTVGTA